MQSLTQKIEAKYIKKQVADVKSGDTVRVHQKIKEGAKERIQIFEGLVIRTKRQKSATSSITVRRISSGIGVEKSFLLHSPLVEKVEVVKRSKVSRNYLTYMRERSGKSARLDSVDFDKEAVNVAELVADTTEVTAEKDATEEVGTTEEPETPEEEVAKTVAK
jgi:large subunit ribosomal protein L19